ncbi:hypothetical protein ACPOL_1375 [Acidisarcina polymorpha]|uniref:Uncharacterized protein n=1 Tax=Acidisarcina polymorpha TaxID=2211140 RepID=A0A2Z5FV05_9BACT|nr:hypothetical protein ACPOL_1375 [Acidisarcina polymorpha]
MANTTLPTINGAQRLDWDTHRVTAPAASEVAIAINRRAHFMPSVKWSVCSAAL